MDRDPWRVAVASMLLCRTRRVQAEPALSRLLLLWLTAGDLARSDTERLTSIIKPCGFGRTRARQLQRFSVRYLGEWTDIAELPGVGVYVSDAVGLFCLNRLDILGRDTVLEAYRDVQMRGLPGG